MSPFVDHARLILARVVARQSAAHAAFGANILQRCTGSFLLALTSSFLSLRFFFLSFVSFFPFFFFFFFLPLRRTTHVTDRLSSPYTRDAKRERRKRRCTRRGEREREERRTRSNAARRVSQYLLTPRRPPRKSLPLFFDWYDSLPLSVLVPRRYRWSSASCEASDSFP